MATDDDQLPAAFRGKRAYLIEDRDVRTFLTMAGWNVESEASQTKHADAWRFLLEHIDMAQRSRTRRAAIIVASASAVVTTCLATGVPILWKLISHQ